MSATTTTRNDERLLLAGRYFAALSGHKRSLDRLIDSGQTLRNATGQELEIRTMTGEALSSAGGFLVPTDTANLIVETADRYGMARRYARRVEMGSNPQTVPREGANATAYLIAESGEIPPSDLGFDGVTLLARKGGALVRCTTELIEDGIPAFGAYIVNRLGRALAKLEDTVAFAGDGSSTYHGMTGLPGLLGTASAIDAAGGHNTLLEIDATDLSAVVEAVPARALEDTADPAWYCSPLVGGRVFARLAAGSSEVNAATYAGYPIRVSSLLPANTGDAAGEALLYFGDLSQAMILGTRGGFRIDVSRAGNGLESDVILYRAIERFVVNLHDVGGTAAGPLAALVGKS